MSKIELPTITSGYNLSAINNNFQKIEDALNEEVLYRKGYTGEPNEMQTNLDMNGKEILNASVGSSPGSLATKGYVDQEIAEERIYVDQELQKKYDKSGGPISGNVQMQGNRISGLPNANQPSEPATYEQLLLVEAVDDSLLRNTLEGPDDKGLTNFYGGGGHTGADASTGNIYNTVYDTNDNALRWRYDIPETSERLPIVYLKKTFNTTRDTGAGGQPSRWDEGTIYSHVVKTNGTAYAAGITSMFDAVGGAGDSVSIHSRANGRRPNIVGTQEGSGVWGLWSFAVATPSDGTHIKQLFGIEIDCINNGQDIPFPLPTGQGGYIGAQVTALSGACSHGVEIGADSTGSWHRGIHIRQSAITPSSLFPDTCAINLEGGTFGERMGGLKFGKGYFDYGINLSKPSEDYASLAAIILGEGNRIFMGNSISDVNYISKIVGQSLFDLHNLSMSINGTKVIGPRSTGIFQLTGTADGASKNTETVTLIELSRYVKKVTDALVAHGMIGPT